MLHKKCEELIGRMLDSRLRGCVFKRHCVVSLSKTLYPLLYIVHVLVNPRIKTHPDMAEKLLTGT